jgi:hypothetical protein
MQLTTAALQMRPRSRPAECVWKAMIRCGPVGRMDSEQVQECCTRLWELLVSKRSDADGKNVHAFTLIHYAS